MLLAACWALVGRAQSFDEYLRTRKSLGITATAGVEALETFVGVRTVEVAARVCGFSRVDGRTVLLLELPEGGYLNVRVGKTPEWMAGGDVRARLIVKASRTSELAEIDAFLIAAAAEHQMSAWEAEEERRSRARREAAERTRRRNPQAAVRKAHELPASDATPHYAQFIKRRNPRLSEAEAWRIAQGVIGFSLRYGVDARLVMAMVLVESGFNPHATSRAGAMGLGQLMPGTARGLGVSNAYDSIDNLYGTVRLIRGHLERYSRQTGDQYRGLVLALAAYNAGSGAVRRHGGVPPYRETQNYVRKVVAVYDALCGRRR
ncbi:MAG: lytic transglycosylase domain-containing protein [Chloroflexaceae bacterium]|nr:lytic transglycosylase domain-containing protein [Chloroflexaceae bacterium]